MPDVYRTPDDRFDGLWSLEPRYTQWEGLRLAWHEAGPPDGHPVVLVHGEPTWGWLYRAYVDVLVSAGCRVLLPDLVGFGRSDKPTDRGWYSYDRLVAAFTATMGAADPAEPVTLVVHDWGGPVGLRWAVEHPDRVARIVMHDTGLYAPGARLSDAFHRWQEYVRRAETLPVADIVQRSTVRTLSDDELRGYEAPFPEPAAQAGALALPLLVPTADDHPSAPAMIAVHQALLAWQGPVLMLWAADDPIIPPVVGQAYAAAIPGAVGCEVVGPAHHFLQEDVGSELAQRIARFIGTGT